MPRKPHRAPDNAPEPEECRRFMVCVRCLAVLNVPPGGEGRRVRCPACGHKQIESDPEGRN